MNTAKHTPGPWRAAKRSWGWDICSQGGIICSGPETSGLNAEANAHLIAAAPAMYQALQAALAYFMRSKQSHAPETQVIRTALAQAEGRHHE